MISGYPWGTSCYLFLDLDLGSADINRRADRWEGSCFAWLQWTTNESLGSSFIFGCVTAQFSVTRHTIFSLVYSYRVALIPSGDLWWAEIGLHHLSLIVDTWFWVLTVRHAFGNRLIDLLCLPRVLLLGALGDRWLQVSSNWALILGSCGFFMRLVNILGVFVLANLVRGSSLQIDLRLTSFLKNWREVGSLWLHLLLDSLNLLGSCVFTLIIAKNFLIKL